jgi:hypothetical protein
MTDNDYGLWFLVAFNRTSCRRRQNGAQSMTVVDDSMAKMAELHAAVQRLARIR